MIKSRVKGRCRPFEGNERFSDPLASSSAGMTNLLVKSPWSPLKPKLVIPFNLSTSRTFGFQSIQFLTTLGLSYSLPADKRTLETKMVWQVIMIIQSP